MRADGSDHAHHVRNVARAVFDADDARAIERQAANRGDINGGGEQRNVVKRYIDADMISDFFEVLVNCFGAKFVVERSDDGDCANTEGPIGFASVDRFADVRFRRACQNWHSRPNMSRENFNNPPAFWSRKSREFPGAAVRVKSMHAPLYQPIYVRAKLIFIHAPLRIDRRDIGSVDAIHRGFGHSGHKWSG